MKQVSFETCFIWNKCHLKLVSFETSVIWNMWHVRTEGIHLLFFLLLWAFNTVFFQTHVVWSRNNNSRINTWKDRNSKDDNYFTWRQFWSYFTFKEWTDLFDPWGENQSIGTFCVHCYGHHSSNSQLFIDSQTSEVCREVQPNINSFYLSHCLIPCQNKAILASK